MTTADRKRLLIALCACDRVELCLHHFKPADPQTALLRQLRPFLPWVGLFSRLFRRRNPTASSGPSPWAGLFQLAAGFFGRSR